MQHTRFLFALPILMLALAGCRDDGAASVDQDAYGSSASALVTTEATLEVSDDVLGFDPVLVRTNTADQNAAAVETHAHDSLTGCGTVTRTGTTLTIDFGTSGCVTPSGHQVTGSIGVQIVARGAVEAGATLTFTSFSVDGTALSGTLGFTTTPSGLDVDVALTSGTNAITGTANIGATTGAFTLTAMLTSTRASATTTLSVAGLVWVRGDCYPSGGSVTATTGRLVQSITFRAATAMTGTVTVTQGPLTSSESLPAYGDCPAP